MAENIGAKRKRSKAFYAGLKKKKRGLELLTPGMKGIIVTCNEREKLCVREAYNVLNEYADKLYGPEIGSQEDDKSSGSEGEEDIEDALAKEVKEMKETQRHKRFQSVLSGANNVVFIKTDLPDNKDPSDLVHHILTDILSTGCRKTRHCQRFIPISGSCRANLQDIKDLGQEMFQSCFFGDDVKPSKFCVMYRARNKGDIHRDDVIAALAAEVMSAGKGHTVDLKYPDLAICVEIIKNVCCMSVVKDLFKLRKYNIHELNEQIHTSTQSTKCNDCNSDSLTVEEEKSNGQEMSTKDEKDCVTTTGGTCIASVEHLENADENEGKVDQVSNEQTLATSGTDANIKVSTNEVVMEK